MRVLLAGASGAIGRHLIPELIASGHEVVGITRTPGALDGTGAIELVANVSHRSSFLAAVEGVSANAVIHQLTSLSKSSLSFRHMRPTNRLRSEGTSTLLAAARRIGARQFVTASAAYGYGFGDAGNEVLDENAPFAHPDGTRNDPIFAALLTNEQQVRAFGGVALRYGVFYEAGAKDVSPVPRHWNGLLPVVHLGDAARATVLAMERGEPGEAYNIVDDEPVTWRELQEMQARADGFSPPIVLPEWLLRRVAPFGAQLMTTMSLQLSNDKAKRELKWTPGFPSLREGLPLAAERSPDDLATMKAEKAKADAARKAADKRASAARAAVKREQSAMAATEKAEAKAAAKARATAAAEAAATLVEHGRRDEQDEPQAADEPDEQDDPVGQNEPADEDAADEPGDEDAADEPAAAEPAAPSAVERLRAWTKERRSRMEERAAARAEHRVERAAERARQQAAVWAAERAAKRAAEEAASTAADDAALDAAGTTELASAEPALDAAGQDSESEAAGAAEIDGEPDADLDDYNDSGSYVDFYLDAEEGETDPETDAADQDAEKELGRQKRV